MTAVEITVNLDFRCSYESKNNGEKPITSVACYEGLRSPGRSNSTYFIFFRSFVFSKSCPKVSAGQVLKVGGLEVAAFDPVYCSLPPLRALCP